MKTKNVRVREKDIKAGRIIYRASPQFGVQKLVVVSRPYVSRYTGNLFFKVKTEYGETEESICDSGINTGDSYNDGKTFFKRKHADEYAKRMKTDPGVILRHERHLERCREMALMSDF